MFIVHKEQQKKRKRKEMVRTKEYELITHNFRQNALPKTNFNNSARHCHKPDQQQQQQLQ